VKVEGWLFLGSGIFFAGADIVYWYTSKDPTGTTALALAVGLAFLTGFYVLFTGRRLPKRPEDDPHRARRRSQGYAGTDRQCRGQLLALLRESDAPVPAARLDASWADASQRARSLASLVADGLAERLPGGSYALPR